MSLIYANDVLPKGLLEERWAASWAASAGRRSMAKKKLAIYDEDWLGMVLNKLRERFPNPDLCSYVQKFATRSPNLARAVVDAIAVCYENGVLRTLRGADEKTARAFTEVVAESGIHRLGNAINARAFLCGPTGVSPHLDQRGRLALDIVTPDRYDLEHDGDNIDAALWLHGNTWIEIGPDSWRYFSPSGELVKVVPHGAAACPLVPFVAAENVSDFWNTSLHAGLLDATLEVAVKKAHGLYVQQVSANKLTVVNGDIEDIGALQSLGEFALPLHLNAATGEAGVSVVDRSIDPTPNWGDISRIISDAVAVYGISPSEVTGFSTNNNEWGSLAIKIRSERLSKLRNKSVPWLAAAERRLWPIVCDLIRSSGHRHAKALPPGSEAADMLRVSFDAIADADEVKKRIEALEMGLSHGLGSASEFERRLRPELQPDEVQEIIDARLEEYAARNKFLATHNTPADASTAGKPLDAQQGREGGLISGEVRRSDSQQKPAA